MSNVLPNAYRKRVIRSARARFVIVGALVMGAGALIAILALLPAFLSVYLPRTALSNSPVPQDAAQTDTARKTVAETHALIDALKPLTRDTSPFSNVMQAIFKALPEGVKVTSVNYTAGDPGSVTVSGSTQRRESVNAYREALAEDERFTSVTVPVAALVGVLSGNFTITLTGAF